GANDLHLAYRDAAVHGLLDAAGNLTLEDQQRLVRRGLRAGQARVRRAALDLMAQTGDPERALRRASSDPDATVRKWQPPAGGR
ncbi:MAG: hypothetical protein ACRDJU_14350, partial [Actinomycetota bacterium]